MNSINFINFRGSGSESSGSLAMKDNPTECPTCGRVNFRGNGSESTGSLSDIDNPLEQPTSDTVNFKGANLYNEDKKGSSVLGIFAGIVLLAGAAIVGLGYAHKANVFEKMSDGKFKNFVKKCEPAAKKCHEWCSTVKTKSRNLWDKVKNLFSSKKS